MFLQPLFSASEPQQNKSTRRSPSIDRYRRSFDDKILPASVSRPHSPLPSEEELLEENNIYRRPSSQGRRISYDDKIVPGVVSRPQTPISDEEYEGH